MHDAVVVGQGSCGLRVAAFLPKQVEIHERRPFPRFLPSLEGSVLRIAQPGVQPATPAFADAQAPGIACSNVGVTAR